MPVSGLASFVTMMLVFVREWIRDFLERGLEAGDLAAVGRSFRLFSFSTTKNLVHIIDYKDECSQIPVTGV